MWNRAYISCCRCVMLWLSNILTPLRAFALTYKRYKTCLPRCCCKIPQVQVCNGEWATTIVDTHSFRKHANRGTQTGCWQGPRLSIFHLVARWHWRVIWRAVLNGTTWPVDGLGVVIRGLKTTVAGKGIPFHHNGAYCWGDKSIHGLDQLFSQITAWRKPAALT